MTRVLVVCMFDSIHTARWLSQFTQNREIEIILFPSRKFRHLNPALRDLLRTRCNISLSQFHRGIPLFFLGYYSFFKFNLLARVLRKDVKEIQSRALRNILNSLLPNIIHALEIQGAGYLLSMALINAVKPKKRILTNWGSDIYFYGREEFEGLRIRKVLLEFTHYSAECQRDYELALKFGFKGEFLPCIPNAGGIEVSKIKATSTLSSSRHLLIVKAYGGKFGLGLLAVSICAEILKTMQSPHIYFYSVTDDVKSEVIALCKRFPGRVGYSTVRKSLPHDEFIEKLKTARCYLGMSKSDGISTSFLESIAYGVFPIQTDTSCAAEWIDLGAVGFITNSDDRVGIVLKIQEIFSENRVVDEAQLKNREIALKHLSFGHVMSNSLLFYQ